MSVRHAAHFDLDIPHALHAQLVQTFDELSPVPLSQIAAHDPPRGTGVYGLHHEGVLVYVGKAQSLARRLAEHANKIAGRQYITPEDVGATLVTVNRNWSAYAPEAILIQHYRTKGLCVWNGTGFGNHDPGRNRELTTKPPDGFDRQFPIRLAWPCAGLNAGRHEVASVLRHLKETLPYLLRYETSAGRTWRDGHVDFDGVTIEVTDPAPAAGDVLSRAAAALPGWQATAFPSHVILYREKRRYAYGTAL